MRETTIYASPPGETIREQLAMRRMTQKEFARRMDMTDKHISHLLNGKVHLTKEMAYRLEMVLGVPVSFWLNLDALYQENLIKLEEEKTINEEAELAKRFPYAEMAKFGWVKETRSVNEKVVALRQFFEVVRLSSAAFALSNVVNFRVLAATTRNEPKLMAWTQQLLKEARKIEIKRFNVNKLKKAIERIRAMSYQSYAEFHEKLCKLLADCGVAFVVLPHMSGSYLHGASFLDGSRTVMGVTMRGKHVDKFWFSFFHELAHVVLGHIHEEVEDINKYEKEADKFAADALIPAEAYEQFNLSGKYSDRSIKGFAKCIGIHPGIVVGRLQHDKLLSHQQMNHLKEDI